MKSLDLKQMGVQELDAKEMKKTNGGLGFLGVVGAGLLIAAGTAIINDWDNFKRGLAGEPEINN